MRQPFGGTVSLVGFPPPKKDACNKHWTCPPHRRCWLVCPPLALTTNTHPFNGPLSGTTQVSRYHRGKTNLGFTEARDSEWQWHQPGHMQVCTLLQTDNHASTPPLSFYRLDALPAAQPTASKHWRHWWKTESHKYTDHQQLCRCASKCDLDWCKWARFRLTPLSSTSVPPTILGTDL